MLRPLSALSRCKLALLCAEAGYGKTTLILDFLGRWPHPAVWYRLDKTDRDVTQFVAYLAEGIAQRLPDFGQELRRLFAQEDETCAEADLPHLLLHEISKLAPQPILVVLDSFEAVAPSEGVCGLVSDLLEYSGPDLHLAIASRTMPPLPVARLVARQEAIVLGPQDLAFTLEESRELLHGLPSAGGASAMPSGPRQDAPAPAAARCARLKPPAGPGEVRPRGLEEPAKAGFAAPASEFIRAAPVEDSPDGPPSLTDAQLDTLWRRTEGWAAGLVMVAETLRRSPAHQVLAGLEGPGGPPDRVYQYFADEVFEQQSEAVRQFLLETSVLKQLSRETINGLLEIDNGGDLLASLKGQGIFILGAEEGAGDLRYHPLFQAFLLKKLHARYGNERLRDLYRRAARLSDRHQQWGNAVECYAAAEDWEKVAEIVERRGEEMIRQGSLQTVRHWLDLLPEEQILRRPGLLLLRGSLLRLSGHHHAALRDLEKALAGLQRQGDRPATVRTQLEIAQAYHRIGEFRKVGPMLSEALGLADNDGVLGSRVLTELSENSIDLDDLEQASRWAGRAIAEAAAADPGIPATISMIRALRFKSRARLLQGELREALQLASRSVELGRREDVADFERAWSTFTLGQVLALQGAFREAFQLFQEAETLAHGDPRPVHRIWTWRGIALRDVEEFDQAARYLRQAERGRSFVGHTAQRELAFLCWRQGRTAEALRLAEEALRGSRVEESPGEGTESQAVYGIALAVQDRRLGLEQLSAASESFRQRGRLQQWASLQWHLARLLVEEGRRAEALERLEAALLWAVRHGLYHFWWWDPETVARLLPEALGAGLAPAYLLELARLRLRPQDCRFLYPALEGVAPELRGPLAVTLRLVSGDSAVHRVAADLLQSCPDARVRRHLAEALGAGTLGPEELVRLRGEVGLTWKEMEVLILYYLRPGVAKSEGRFRHRLAESLGLSEETLKVHIRNVRRKLELPDRRRDAHLPASLMLQRLQQEGLAMGDEG